MGKNRLVLIALGVVLLFSAQVFAAEKSSIGEVKTFKVEAHILRGDKVIPASEGLKLYSADQLETGPKGAIGVIFRDGTMLTLGPSSEFEVREYVFKPLEKKTSLISYMSKGTASYVSGAIARMNPDSVKIKTPTAYLGLRGTKVLIEVE